MRIIQNLSGHFDTRLLAAVAAAMVVSFFAFPVSPARADAADAINFTASNPICFFISLDWTNGTASNYDIYRGSNPDYFFSTSIANGVTSGPYTDTTPAPNAPYNYWIRDHSNFFANWIPAGTNSTGGIAALPTGCSTNIPTGRISHQIWEGISGSTVLDLTSNAAFPQSPTRQDEPAIFEGPVNFGNNYGSRFRGYIFPPATGNYTFWISSDDSSELWLSTDSNPANKVRIARVPSWTNSRDWTRFSQQKSASIPLVAGSKYYIEALHKQGSSGDNIAVGWQLPGGALERPIPGSRLSPYYECDPNTMGSNRMVGCLYEGRDFNRLVTNAPSGPLVPSLTPKTGTLFPRLINVPEDTIGPGYGYSMRWKGTFNFPAGLYEFTGGYDDGVRLYVDGNLIIDNWIVTMGGGWGAGIPPPDIKSTQIQLTAGPHTILYEYFEDGFNGAGIVLTYERIAQQPPPPSLSFVNSDCGGGQSNITLSYSADPSVYPDGIRIFRDIGSGPTLVYTDTSAPISPVTEQFTDTGLTYGQTYTYTAVAYVDTLDSQPSASVPIMANTCLPRLSITFSLAAINGIPGASTATLKDGDIVTLRVLFQNVGAADATRVNVEDVLTNITYDPAIPSSFFCDFITCQLDSSAAQDLTFHTTQSLGVNRQFYMNVKGTVQVSNTNQQASIANILVKGTYEPGGIPFDYVYTIVARSGNNLIPKIREIAP